MAIGFVIGLVVGYILGLAFTIWLVTAAGYDWQQILHRWYVALVYWRHKAEIDEGVDGG